MNKKTSDDFRKRVAKIMLTYVEDKAVPWDVKKEAANLLIAATEPDPPDSQV